MEYKEKIDKLVKSIKKQGYNNICFWLPAYNVGGGTYYLCKLAQYLVKNTDFNVYYMDYPEGYPSSILADTPEVEILEYNENNIKFPIKDKCIIVTNSTRAIQINKMNPDNKILFWHYETHHNAWKIVFLRGETHKFLQLTEKEHAMTAIDKAAFISLGESGGLEFTNKNYLYVNLPLKTKQAPPNYIEEDALNVCFLSRLAPDKKQSLYYFIKEYAKYKTDKKKKLHIIGDGVSAQEVHEFCEEEDYNSIEFIFTGTIPKEDLDDYLINNTDIVFAVGTSVLEGAALKLPSVILFVDVKEIEEDSAVMLYDSKDHCVALMPEQKEKMALKYTRICDILDKVFKNNNKEIEGQKCYDYYVKNHSNYDHLVCSFLQNLKDTTLTQRKLRKCIRYIPYNLLSIKTYSPFGIPLYTIIKHYGIVKYKLFGITVFKKKTKGKITKYYLFGIKFQTSKSLRGHRFPAAQFADGKRSDGNGK